MITLLIVDDEDFAINYLCESIDFNTLGITNVIKANDSREALELAHSNKIDILMTDINMPVITGIDLGTQIKTFTPECSIIFMSGYSEKEYYKSAIKLGVVAFIEKPFNISEIYDTLKLTAEKVKEQKSSLINKKILTKTIEKDITLELTKTILDYDLFCKKLLACNLDILEQSHIISGLIKFVPKNDDIDFSSLESTVYDSISDMENPSIIYAFKQDNLLLFHLYSENEITKQMLTDVYSKITEKTEDCYNTISAFGNNVFGIGDVHNSYQEAVTNLEAGFILGYNKIISQTNETESYSFPKNFTQNLLEGFKTENKELVMEIINDTIQKISLQPCTPSISIKNQFSKAINKINDITNIPEEKSFLFSQQAELIQNANTLSEIRDIFFRYINDIFILNTVQYSPAVKKALSYIHGNYRSNDFRLKDIGNHTSMNTSYICTLFKNETGETINQYLVGYRVKKAQELLITTNETIEAIVKNVGYTDTKHFFKIFKKITGMTPAQYRKKFTNL